MPLGKLMFAPTKALMGLWLLGFGLVAYGSLLAYQHMKQSIAAEVLLPKPAKLRAAPAMLASPPSDTLVASAMADEAAAPHVSAPSEDKPPLVAIKADEDSPAPVAASADLALANPVVPVEVPASKAEESHSKKPRNSKDTFHTKPANKPLQLTINRPSRRLHPTVMQAYQAYSEGDDTLAQQHYQQVLQEDGRNVDALLGMAAIAQHQGQAVDAAAWYQAVLDVAPKNSVALLASVLMKDKTEAESRIKSLLVQLPDADYLHAALANLYAEQGLWPAAEEAYFNASRLAPDRADYAFNLAVSLDQMGKSQLALQQYRRALVLLKPSASDSLSKVAIELRMQQLE